uniref:Acetylcholinesterase n=1 Tax=Parastrongyloides trichosuri TaxID=131310 RepID=A0A0N4ZZT1_PARTI
MGTNISVFLGIPYAESPVGNLRFKPPQELRNIKYATNEPLKAFTLGNSCYQPILWQNFKLWDMFNPINNMSEDCLRLNIYHPSNNNKQNSSAIVFFHGGDYTTGSSAPDIYNASYLAIKSNSTIITVNYRLGIFGFGYFGSNYTDVPGNMGLLDQQMALKWIKKNMVNITGTNQTKITLFGEGAGGASATAHLLAKNSTNLFDRIITTSGTIDNKWAVLDKGIIFERSYSTALRLNCTSLNNPNITDIVKCLQEVNATKLLFYSVYFNPILEKVQPPFIATFTPIYNDSLFFEKHIRYSSMIDNMKKDVDIIIGKVSNESTVFMPMYFRSAPFNCSFNSSLPKNASENQCNMNNESLYTLFNATLAQMKIPLNLTHDLIKLYNKSVSGSNRDKLAHFLSDIAFDCDIIKYALRYKNFSTSQKTYFFNYRRNLSSNSWPDWMGVVHRSDLEAEFGLPFKNESFYGKNKLEEEKKFSEEFMKMLGNFAKTGNPGDFWRPYNNTTKEALLIDNDFKFSNKQKRKRRTSNKSSKEEQSYKHELFTSETCDEIDKIYSDYFRNISIEMDKYFKLLNSSSSIVISKQNTTEQN